MTARSSKTCRQFIGGMLVNCDDPNYAWFGDTYARVTSAVQHTGAVIHFVRYESRNVQFAGVEVARSAEIPEGLIAWELRDDTWSMRRASGEVIWQAPLTWQWRAVSEAGRWIGEFSARCPEEWGGGLGVFQMTANSYLRPGEACDDEIALVDPNPAWPRQYAAFAAWLREALGPEVALRVEHYGSTAIPGMPAKPIIDVLVEVPSFDIARPCVLPLLNREEWEYWWYRDHMVFIKREALLGRRTHHLHLAPAGHRLWEGIAFRDYLIAHPQVAVQYAELKQELAARHREDREGYTAAKTAFVQKVTAKALQNR